MCGRLPEYPADRAAVKLSVQPAQRADGVLAEEFDAALRLPPP
jgi:hypothetical protein